MQLTYKLVLGKKDLSIFERITEYSAPSVERLRMARDGIDNHSLWLDDSDFLKCRWRLRNAFNVEPIDAHRRDIAYILQLMECAAQNSMDESRELYEKPELIDQFKF